MITTLVMAASIVMAVTALLKILEHGTYDKPVTFGRDVRKASPSKIQQLERECEIRNELGELVHKPQPEILEALKSEDLPTVVDAIDRAGRLAPGEHIISMSEYRRAHAEKIARDRHTLEKQGREYDEIKTLQGTLRLVPRDGLPVMDKFYGGIYIDDRYFRETHRG